MTKRWDLQHEGKRKIFHTINKRVKSSTDTVAHPTVPAARLKRPSNPLNRWEKLLERQTRRRKNTSQQFRLSMMQHTQRSEVRKPQVKVSMQLVESSKLPQKPQKTQKISEQAEVPELRLRTFKELEARVFERGSCSLLSSNSKREHDKKYNWCNQHKGLFYEHHLFAQNLLYLFICPTNHWTKWPPWGLGFRV